MFIVKQLYNKKGRIVAFIFEFAERRENEMYFTLAIIYPKISKYGNHLKFLKQYIGFQIVFKKQTL